MRVLVAGAGIGGLTTALALHARGIDVRVFEAARELAPLGVGINLLPHAMAELGALGALDEIAALGVRTAELCYFNHHGQLIWREPRGLDAGYPVPQISLHRGKLQLALFDLVRARLGADAVRTGCTLDAFANEDARTVRADFSERATGAAFTERADVLVAADGIHSAVRRQLHPDEGLPRWSGNILWRATSRALPFLTGRSMIMAGSRPRKFVAYPISGVAPDGLCTINWIAELDRSRGAPPPREDWNRAGAIADFLPDFADWVFDWLDVPALIRSAEAVFEFPMVDRDPLARWTHGRATLLGDAAHPMYPIGSNGASQAILDARALADALAEEGDVDAALARYEAARRPATAQIVLSNRQHGPECVLDMAAERAPGGFARVDDVFAPGELAEIAARYKRVAGFATRSPA
jgi:2-polyprenyl-6-methoxyphenol hydroxylase-like FAD-dependent oxidoreductase